MNIDFSDMNGGIIQDLPAELIGRNQWSDGNNARFVRAQVSKIVGHTEVFGTSSASSTITTLALGKAIWLNSIDDDNQDPWWVYCDTDRIFATDGVTHYHISYSATSSASQTAPFAATLDYGWNGGNFNGVAIINSHAQLPRYWVPGASDKTIELTASGIFTACRVMRPYKTFLMAIGVDEGAGFNDNVVIWPTAADVGGLPPSWDYSDTTEDAGRVELDDGFGVLIDGERMRNDFVVYAEHAIYRFSPVPSNAIFSIRRIFSEVGLLTRNCIATVRHRHVFFGDGDIYMHDGQSIDSIVTKKWKNWVFSQIGENWRRSYVVANYEHNEVWFCFPVGVDEHPTRALVWDFDDNTFSSRDLIGSTLGGASFMAYGKMPQSDDDSFDTGPDITFDGETEKVFDTTDSEINVRDIVMVSYLDINRFVTLTGTATSIAGATIMIDAGTDFVKGGVLTGDTITNVTTSSSPSVILSVSVNTIVCTDSIWTPGNLDDYRIETTTTTLDKSAFFEVDTGLRFDESSYTFHVEKDCLPLGRNGRFSQYDEYQVHAIRPRVRSAIGGNLTVKVYMRDSVGDAPALIDTTTFVIGVDDKVDVRATGTVCTVRFECSDDTDVEINGFGIDYDIVGSRPR